MSVRKDSMEPVDHLNLWTICVALHAGLAEKNAFWYRWGVADDHSKNLVKPLHHALSTDLNRMIAALSLEPQA